MKHFIFPDIDHDTPVDFQIQKRIKKVFYDFVKGMPAEIGTELPESIELKLEPTSLLSTPQLAAIHGKRLETHVVLSKDGYLLTLHRLINPCINEGCKANLNETILLHHGLLGSSADWILLGPNKSLPYLLSNMGYDVWMINARGNYYSRGHINMNVNDVNYWKFSWHEMGYYDLPAVLEYMKSAKSNDLSINFIGHSMGTTCFLVLLSSLSDYNKYFKMGILLAPLSFLNNAKGPINLIPKNPTDHVLKLLGNGEFLAHRRIPTWLRRGHCTKQKMFCSNPLFFITGGAPDAVNYWENSFTARVLHHVPAGGSTNTILHYAQLVKSGKFHKFDKEDDEYELSKITVPIAFITSSDDWLSTIPDVLRLYFSVTNPIDHYIIRDKNISHTDFVWGPSANELIFEKVFFYLMNGLNYESSYFNEV
ncbi:lipase 3-like [Leptidea sinapis]|uniref:lipase 3-like n=1 Tax=Leptidea sinapis TaxID=189913 RepID=UPI0021C2FD8A|nr:lipase 3-like [Leptidea sinapis]